MRKSKLTILGASIALMLSLNVNAQSYTQCYDIGNGMQNCVQITTSAEKTPGISDVRTNESLGNYSSSNTLTSASFGNGIITEDIITATIQQQLLEIQNSSNSSSLLTQYLATTPYTAAQIAEATGYSVAQVTTLMTNAKTAFSNGSTISSASLTSGTTSSTGTTTLFVVGGTSTVGVSNAGSSGLGILDPSNVRTYATTPTFTTPGTTTSGTSPSIGGFSIGGGSNSGISAKLDLSTGLRTYSDGSTSKLTTDELTLARQQYGNTGTVSSTNGVVSVTGFVGLPGATPNQYTAGGISNLPNYNADGSPTQYNSIYNPNAAVAAANYNPNNPSSAPYNYLATTVPTSTTSTGSSSAFVVGGGSTTSTSTANTPSTTPVGGNTSMLDAVTNSSNSGTTSVESTGQGGM